MLKINRFLCSSFKLSCLHNSLCWFLRPHYSLLWCIFALIPLLSTSQVVPLTTLNTPYYSEYSPSKSFDGRTLVFVSNESGRWRLYESKRMGEGRWSKPISIDAINNSVKKRRFIGGCFQSYDGKYLLLVSDRKDGFGSMDILISEKKDDQWGEPVNIGEPVNSSHYEGAPSMSSDGNELYFMRNFRPGMKPEKDRYYLYVSKKKEDGLWDEPQMLPQEINKYKVECPRILPNGQSLLFASVRPDSRGGLDIYRAEKLEDGNWSEPVNMELLNSSFDENTFTVDALGELMYFARTENGIDNLYVGTIPEKDELVPTLQLKGKVLDAQTNKPLAAEIKLIDADTKETLKLLSTTEVNPGYSIYLQRGKNIFIEANSMGYSFGQESVFLKSPELVLNEKGDGRMELDQIFNQLILDKDDQIAVDEALKLTLEANDLMTKVKMANEGMIKDLETKSLISSDSKATKKMKAEIAKLKSENQRLDNEAIAKYRIANQSFLDMLSKYIGKYKVTSDEKIADLGQKLEEEGSVFWSQSKTKRTEADNGKSNSSILKAHAAAKELEMNAIKKYSLAFEYYLQFLNFNKNVIEKDIYLTPLQKDVSIVLKNIQFAFNSDKLNTLSLYELDKVLQLMTSNPKLKIELSAHTDSQGTDEYNLDLSLRRANSVVSWLIANNVSIDRLKAVGYGESRPLVPNDSRDNLAKNRRVEFKILDN
ncbi:MAG: OmpA family protein [Bacteroidales bacterium]|nr:OmpA family protein [Bacteroidales bacterium]MCF8458787.1 OmpA family protein [Bacteroidales bacterium]